MAHFDCMDKTQGLYLHRRNEMAKKIQVSTIRLLSVRWIV
jgi:hypothetical protein